MDILWMSVQMLGCSMENSAHHVASSINNKSI
jgi:hypothetical protein